MHLAALWICLHWETAVSRPPKSSQFISQSETTTITGGCDEGSEALSLLGFFSSLPLMLLGAFILCIWLYLL